VYYKYKIGNDWKPYFIALQSVHAISDVIAVAHGDRVHVFVVDFENRALHLTWTGAVEPAPQRARWAPLGSAVVGNVAAAAVLGSGHVYVFARLVVGGAIYCKTLKDGAWAPSWQPLGDMRALGSPAAAAAAVVAPTPAPRLLVATRDAVNRLRVKQWDGHAWQPANDAPGGGWDDLAGVVLADIAVAAAPDADDGRVDTFHLALAGGVSGRAWDGSEWRDWVDLKGDGLVSAPAVYASRARLDLYALDAGNRVVCRSRIRGEWVTQWTPLQGMWTSPPVAHPTRQGEVYIRGHNGSIYVYE
jgi:hypothetical protein